MNSGNKTTMVLSGDFPDLRTLAEEIDSRGVPSGATVIYQGRNTVYRLPLAEYTSLSHGFTDINIKAFRTPVFPNAFIYGRLRQSKARRSYEHALRLEGLGIRTPRPIAFIEHSGALRFGSSYFISEQLSEEWEMVRYAHLRPDFDHLADGVAAFMIELHSKKVWMKDFSPGNLLFRHAPTPTGFEFALLDINRMEFGVTDRKKLMENFRCIFDTMEATLVLAAHYARRSGLTPGTRAWDRIISDAREAFNDKQRLTRRKKRLKALFGHRS